MDKVREKVAAMGLGEQVIPFSARFETKLLNMSEEEAKAYCEKYHTKSQLPRIITTGYHVLNLIPSSPREPMRSSAGPSERERSLPRLPV